MLSFTLYSCPPYDSTQVCIGYKGRPVELLVRYNGGEDICLFLQNLGEEEKSNIFKIMVPDGVFNPFCVSTKEMDPDQDQLTSMFSALTTTEHSDCDNQEKPCEVECDVVEIEEGLFSTRVYFTVKMKRSLEYVRKEKGLCPSVTNYLVDRIRADSPVNIFCTKCGVRLTSEEATFEKVACCCEGMSSELSENWFCHAEATAPQAKSQSSQLLCFDSSSLYLHSSITEKMSGQKVLEGTALACSGCKSVLTPSSRRHGKSCFTGFFCDKVELRHLKDTVEEDYAWEMTWAILRGMMDDSSPVCKLYLHSKGLSEESCLLLCIRSPKVLWFSAQSKDLPNSISLATQEAYQVSFLACKPGSKLVGTWRHDFQVDFYYVSDSMLRTVEEYLASMSETLPKSFPAYTEEFRESFLPMSCLKIYDA